MTNKKWAVKGLTINLASSESQTLDNYCNTTGRLATEVIWELIRNNGATANV